MESERERGVCGREKRRIASRLLANFRAAMPDDWEDDDWEQADLSLPKAGDEAKAEWSDEEAHDADAEEAKPARAAPPPATSLHVEPRASCKIDF